MEDFGDEELLALAAQARKIKKRRKTRLHEVYLEKIAAGAQTHGGHLGTCDGLFGSPYCTCGKESR